MKMYAAVALVVLALAACTSTPAQKTASAEERICVREEVTGSNIPKLRCYTEAERREEQRAVEEVQDAVHRAVPTRTRGSGGTQ